MPLPNPKPHETSDVAPERITVAPEPMVPVKAKPNTTAVETTRVIDAPVDPKAKTALSIFLSVSGYKADDVLDYNETSRLFVTSNGGKYHLSKTGIRILKGPVYPKFVEE